LRKIKALRKLGASLSLEDVASSMCQTNNLHFWSKSLTVDEPIAGVPLAWVPLVGKDGEYFNIGLLFQIEAGIWRFNWSRSSGQSILVLPRQYDTIYQQIAYATPHFDDIETLPATCTLAPPPALTAVSKEAFYQLETGFSGEEKSLPGPKNRIGTLQRAAVKRYAEGIARRESGAAQALHAEVLVRSAYFESAANQSGKAQLSQLLDGFRYAERAHAKGIEVSRFSKLATLIARIYHFGTAETPVDLSQALKFYLVAANWGDADALVNATELSLAGAGRLDCGALIKALSASIDDYASARNFALASLLALCPDAAYRNGTQSLKLLSEHHPSQQVSQIRQAALCAAGKPAAAAAALTQDLADTSYQKYMDTALLQQEQQRLGYYQQGQCWFKPIGRDAQSLEFQREAERRLGHMSLPTLPQEPYLTILTAQQSVQLAPSCD
jgi:hypothetical protein